MQGRRSKGKPALALSSPPLGLSFGVRTIYLSRRKRPEMFVPRITPLFLEVPLTLNIFINFFFTSSRSSPWSIHTRPGVRRCCTQTNRKDEGPVIAVGGFSRTGNDEDSA